MSGGSHDYIFAKIENELCGKMRDVELNDLIQDVANLAYALEWCDSGDTDEEDYKQEVIKFKQKWFKSDRQARLKGYVDKEIENLKERLYNMIGV